MSLFTDAAIIHREWHFTQASAAVGEASEVSMTHLPCGRKFIVIGTFDPHRLLDEATVDRINSCAAAHPCDASDPSPTVGNSAEETL